MAMVGSLALHTDDDQEDSDFFDQLASEFGDGDLGLLQSGFQQEEKDRLDDSFSKLILGEEEPAPAPAPAPAPPPPPPPPTVPVFSSIAEQIDENDLRLKEEKVEETAFESNSCIPADQVFLPGVDPQVKSSGGDALATDELCTLPDHGEKKESLMSLIVGPPSSTDELASLPVHGEEKESLIVGPPSSFLTENNVVLKAPPESVLGRVLDTFGSKDVCTPESGTLGINTNLPSCILPGETPELDSTFFGDNESRQATSSMLVKNASSFSGVGISNAANVNGQFEAATVSPLALSSDCDFAEPVNAESTPNVDVVESAGIKELQWSSFGNSYIPDALGSYSDFFSELGSQALVETTTEIGGYQVESLMDPSPTVFNAQGSLNVEGESLGLQAASAFYGSAAEHFGERAFWDQQGGFNYGINEQDNSSATNVVASLIESHRTIESKQSCVSSTDAMSETGSAIDSSRTANYEAQPQNEAQQSWENMYPGWYFDYASNEWRQIEGWSAVQEQHSMREDTDLSFSQTSQSSLAVGMASDSILQSNQGQDLWTSNRSFATGTQATSDEQQFASSSVPEHQATWEEQYPGWYYDYQAQQWCQIADDGPSNQDTNLGVSQVVEPVQNLHPLGRGWTDQQVQPQYHSEVNQNNYLPESLYSSSRGGDTSTLTRGMSFNTWAEPTTRGSVFGQQGMDKAQEGGNINSWTGFQGGESAVASHTYQGAPAPINQSQQDFTLANQSSFFGNSGGFFQSHNTSAGAIAGARSSVGRPSHALVAFGFGGKLVTMKAPQLGNAEPIVLHDLNQLVSRTEQCGQNNVFSYFSALNRQGLSGPLHGATSKDVLKWVDEQIENCGKEDLQGMNSEGLWVLWGVLKISCLHYGKLRSAAASMSIKSQMEDGPEVALGRFLTAAKSHSHWNQGLATAMDVVHSLPTGHQLQAAVNEVRDRLMDGKRKEALQYAQQGQLWGLALVLAWQLGEKVYADTISQMAQQQFSPGSPMRTLLLLFAGQASELFKVQSLPLSAGTYGPFLSPASNAQDSAGGMLRDWLGNLSIIAANPTKGDEQVITHLGDSLWKDQGEVAGAHTCYLVADTSFESFSKEARLCLAGADHFRLQRTFATPQAIQRTELYEYAKMLGNPQYVLVPFQPFKLLYAHMLAEAGRITEAGRYCQMVLKNLKSAGRGPEIEFCKQFAVTLEERLRLHSQGGYSLNFSTGKLVGKVMGTIDSTIHKIIGGPPLPQPPSPAFGSSQDWYANDGNANSSTKIVPLIPSASNNNLFSVNSQVDVPTRSISEPNLIRSSTQELNAATMSETSSASPNQSSQLKSAGSNGGYLGRFGSQFFAKAIGLIKHNKEAKLGDENKFYYDKKLKRWVEAGVEHSTEEAVLAPPPIVASFSPSLGSPSDAKSGVETQGQGAGVSSSADLPPMPPSANQFSARGRLHGVRSRYVDTFNKGSVQAAPKPSQSPVIPAAGGGWGVASNPSQFFASASFSAATNGSSDTLANGHNNEGSPEFLKPASDHMKGGYLHVENEPLLPKNLNTSFMDVPVFQKHSSTGNMAMLTDNDHTPVKSDALSLGNMARAVSWSGGSPNTFSQHRLSNGSIADVHTKTSSNFTPTSTLLSPPVLEPPPSYAGYESGQMQAVAVEGMLSGSLQGATFGEMQEVEL